MKPFATYDETGVFLETPPDFRAEDAVIICPGGGYCLLAEREAWPVAAAFQKAGWKPYILRYSTGENLGAIPLREAAWAAQTVRKSHSGRLVICGFSAGGHLAASLGVHWNNPAVFPDAALRISQRPDALVLCYPVITAGEHAHQESMRRLAGTGDRGFYSLEEHVSADTPPAFLWHTAADETVPVQNTMRFAKKLMEHHIPTELHIYPFGVHGLSLATPDVDEPEKNRLADSHVAGWFSQCIGWLDTIRFYDNDIKGASPQ